jgi:hypothetical protein
MKRMMILEVQRRKFWPENRLALLAAVVVVETAAINEKV